MEKFVFLLAVLAPVAHPASMSSLDFGHSYGYGHQMMGQSHGKCEPIQLEMCKDIGYNLTSMPNLIDHETQEDAAVSLETFRPLIKIGCSAKLRIFLCAVHAPMCSEKIDTLIGPCRNLCNSVRAKCLPVLEQFGYTWPVALNCSSFPPENNDKHMCMEGPEVDETKRGNHVFEEVFEDDFHDGDESEGFEAVEAPPPPNPIEPPKSQSCSEYRHSKSFVFLNRTGRCAQICENPVVFAPEDRNFAEIWMGIWAAFCAVCTFFTVATYFMEPSAFPYPERPIVILSGCYLLVALGVLIRMVAGYRNLACVPYAATKAVAPELAVLVQNSLGSTGCAVVFLLTYYCGMAAAVWWVMLTLTWTIWVNKSLDPLCQATSGASGAKPLRSGGAFVGDRCSSFYHVVAWGVPAILTILVVVMNRVDADPLTGLCYVGNQDTQALLYFVLVPQLAFLLFGLTFLCIGGWRAVAVRRRAKLLALTGSAAAASPGGVLAQQQNGAITVRMGIFGVLYVLPASCVLGCGFYEYFGREGWLMASTDGAGAGGVKHPNVELFMLKIFMSLVVGITASMWTWSGSGGQTLSIWRRRCRCLGRSGRGYSGSGVTAPLPEKPQQLNNLNYYQQTPQLQLQQQTQPLVAHPSSQISQQQRQQQRPQTQPQPQLQLRAPSLYPPQHPQPPLPPLPPHLPHEAELLMGPADISAPSLGHLGGSNLRLVAGGSLRRMGTPMAPPSSVYGSKHRHTTESTIV